MKSFTTLLWTACSETVPRSTWAERMLVAFRAIQEHAGVERFWTIGHEPEEIVLEPAALEELIVAMQSTDAVGEPWPEKGSTFGVLCTDPGGDPKRARFQVGLTVNCSAGNPPRKNVLTVRLDPETGAEVARAVLEACVSEWSPFWGCVISDANEDGRQDEFEATLGPEDEGRLLPISSRLHWVTFFGPARAAELDLAAVESRQDVIVQPLSDGVEVVLGERWESDEVLRERQRELEPLLLGERATAG